MWNDEEGTSLLVGGSDSNPGLIRRSREYLRHQLQKRSVQIGTLVTSVVVVAVVIGLVFGLHETKRIFQPTVIMISIDSFRSVYITRNPETTKNFQSLISGGAYVPSLRPIFPSKTFPNHYTLATGLFAETHGIVSNTFYDPVFNATFTIDSKAVGEARWWGGEPIWVTAVKQGQRSATEFWPGSEAPIMNTRPTYWKTYDSKVSSEDRIGTILSYLELPDDKRPTFLSGYFDVVDIAGHAYGPDSKQVDDAVAVVDSAIGKLIAGLEKQKIRDKVNVILVSDHGMTAVSRERVVFIDQYVNMSLFKVVDWTPILFIIPTEGKSQEVYDALHGAHPNLTVYFKNDTDEYWNYRDNRRITPIVGVADLGWSIGTTALFNSSQTRYTGGTHGYDNRLPDMQAFLVGNGPVFKSGTILEMMVNLNVYPLLCHILGLIPAPNNGTVPTDLLVAGEGLS
eukprot:TRINITY_DN5267_c0_g1_i2.p1 TRINITY_DN5267_c0_g1~~TRINITY_DN5267_c0_g1_i2.p1  ORF type:complete len:454 (-),score=67.43 TRINITY_DN5267_c0_g1_i2:141-1502(-)